VTEETPDSTTAGSARQEPRPAKKSAARPRRAAKRAAAKGGQVEVALIRKSRGYAIGEKVTVDEARASEMVDSGLASYTS
jgi:actin-like ATPase involved in cell morphogenesis